MQPCSPFVCLGSEIHCLGPVRLHPRITFPDHCGGHCNWSMHASTASLKRNLVLQACDMLCVTTTAFHVAAKRPLDLSVVCPPLGACQCQ